MPEAARNTMSVSASSGQPMTTSATHATTAVKRQEAQTDNVSSGAQVNGSDAPEKGQGSASTPSGGEPSKLKRLGRFARRGVAAVAIAWGFLLVAPLPIVDATPECTTTTKRIDVTAEIDESVSTCKNPGLATMLPFVLVAVFVLLPDFSEVGVPGLVTVKRRLESQEERLDLQETRYQLLSASFQSAAQANQVFNFHGNEFNDSVLKKSASLGASKSSDTHQTGPIMSDERRELVDELQRVAEQLKSRRQSAETLPDAPEQYDQFYLKKWSDVYKLEIAQVIDAAGKSVNNAYGIGLNDLQSLVSGAKQMLAMIELT